MADQDVFKEQEKENTNPDTTERTDVQTLLQSIVGQDGQPKYKDIETALSSITHSQEHIKTLEEENRKARERLAALERETEQRESLEELLEKVKTPSTQQEQQSTTPAETAFDEDKLATLVENKLKAQLENIQKQNQSQANVAKVSDFLVQKYGEEATKVMADKAKSLNVSIEQLREQAANTPDLVMALFGETGVSSSPTNRSTFIPPKEDKLEPPKFEKSLMNGGVSNKELIEAFRESVAYTNKRLGVEE